MALRRTVETMVATRGRWACPLALTLLLVVAACSSGGVPDSVRGSELSDAVGRSDVAAVVELLRNGADPNAEDEFSNLPLVLASSTSSAEVVSALLAAGADPKLVADGFRWTALGAAATRTDADAAQIVSLLLQTKSDVCALMPAGEATDRFQDLYDGMRPIEIARAVGNSDVETLLALAERPCDES